MTNSTVIHFMPFLTHTRTVVIPECLITLGMLLSIVLIGNFFYMVIGMMMEILHLPLEYAPIMQKTKLPDKEKPVTPILLVKKEVPPSVSKDSATFLKRLSELRRLQAHINDSDITVSDLNNESCTMYTRLSKEVDEQRFYYTSYIDKLRNKKCLSKDHHIKFMSLLNDNKIDALPVQDFMLSLIDATIEFNEQATKAHLALQSEYIALQNKITSSVKRSHKEVTGRIIYNVEDSAEMNMKRMKMYAEYLNKV